MADLIIPKDDKGYYLYFTVQKADGSVFNLEGYTVTLKVWQAGRYGTLLVTGGCNLVSGGTGGMCRYLVVEGNFTIRGRYRAELELTKEGVIESTENFVVKVIESA